MENIQISGSELTLETLISSSLLNHVYGGVYFVDRNRKIKLWNKAAEKITGYTAEEVIGSYCHDNVLKHENIIGVNLCQSYCPLIAAMNNDTHIEDRVYLFHKEGYKIPVWVNIIPIKDKNNNIIGAIENFVDDTEHEDLRIAKKKLQKYYDRMLTELDSAKIIHESILSRIDYPDNINFRVSFKPHHSIGGDFYGIIKVDDNKNFVYIGDVSGKGIPAAILTCYMKNEIDFIVRNLKDVDNFSPAKVLYEVNNSTMEVMKSTRSQTTLWCGIIDCKNKTLSYSSAGHENPLKVNGNATTIIANNGILIGFLKNYRYDNNLLNINNKDLFILYTDGITDQRTFNDKKLGKSWLIKTINELDNKTQIPQTIIEKLEKLLKTNKQVDDMLIMSLQLR